MPVPLTLTLLAGGLIEPARETVLPAPRPSSDASSPGTRPAPGTLEA